MTTQRSEEKSIPEQIIEAMLSRLEKSDAYDQTVLSKLKQVAASGKLTSVKAVTQAISVRQE